jgi:hypothetical protein
MPIEQAERLKKLCDVVCRVVRNSRLKDLTIHKILSERKVSAKEVIDLFDVLKSMTRVEEVIVVSDILSITHVRENVAEQYIFHLVVKEEEQELSAYSCHYDKASNDVIVQSEDVATEMFTLYHSVY